ncbi:lycopene cyclase family protein [Tautonia rosea]|uniref:lycopene cyclase family protein n=1 Tax=Tautonia rosea TaxID=2728037 RepID=UPI00147283B1|nr:lycopene cyclase family protein [Tautonia rosea]
MISPPRMPQTAISDSRDSILVPRHRTPRPSTTTYDHVILGAGCAGLSLAWHLRSLGDRGSMALVDRRPGYANDRTWCYWDVEPTPFDDLATHAWTRWAVVDERGNWIESQSTRYRYRRLRSIDVYRRILDRLAGDDAIDPYLGASIRATTLEAETVAVDLAQETIRGVRAYTSARRPAALAEAARSGEAAMVQHFLGQTVRTEHSVFDPACPILMDFRVDQSDGPHFVYVLPLSDREALVENTYLFPDPVSASRHREEIASYLDRCFDVERYEVIEEEAGRIPMTTHRPNTAPGARIVPIGLAGGAARPSSGYAFVRIQRQCRRIAEQIAGNRSTRARLDAPIADRKYDFFDAVFLRALLDRPSRAPDLFARMFDGVDADPLVRFLSDRSTLTDDLRMVAALPKVPFLIAASRSTRAWLPRCLGIGSTNDEMDPS